jgi:hypothetical protein
MKLIITDKPNVQFAVNEALQDIEADGLCNLFRFYKFNDLDYSFPSHPIYKCDNELNFFYPMYHHGEGHVKKGKSFKFSENTRNNLLKYTEISFFLDSSRTDVRSTDLFLDYFFGKLKQHHSVTFTWIDNYSTKHIQEIYESRLDYFEVPSVDKELDIKNYQKIEQYRKAYEIKDYIDFNFNGLMKKNFPTKKLVMTRNKIMTLLILKQYSFNDSMDSRDVMGREMKEFDIGTSWSRSEILTTLIHAKMVTPELYRLTKKAKEFLMSLPETLKDFDGLAHLRTIELCNDYTHEQKIKAVNVYLSKMFQGYI